MVTAELKFGAFLPNLEPNMENECFPRHILLIQKLERLGFDQVWVHANNQIRIDDLHAFFAAAASSTETIRLGLLLPVDMIPNIWDKFAQLAEISDNRLSICLGQGNPSADCKLRKLLDVRKLDLDISIGSQISPSGAQVAGQYGLGLMSIAATAAAGFDALPSNWEIYARYAKKHEFLTNRTKWSLIAPMHIASTKRAAIKQVQPGFKEWVRQIDDCDSIDCATKSGTVVVGPAKSAIDQIKKLKAQTGGFGTLILMCHNWANSADTLNHYQLFADRVIPKFRSAL